MISEETVLFGQGWTIEAAIRLKNPLVERGPDLQELVEKFNELNGYECPKMYQSYRIPIDDRYVQTTPNVI